MAGVTQDEVKGLRRIRGQRRSCRFGSASPLTVTRCQRTRGFRWSVRARYTDAVRVRRRKRPLVVDLFPSKARQRSRCRGSNVSQSIATTAVRLDAVCPLSGLSCNHVQTSVDPRPLQGNRFVVGATCDKGRPLRSGRATIQGARGIKAWRAPFGITSPRLWNRPNVATHRASVWCFFSRALSSKSGSRDGDDDLA